MLITAMVIILKIFLFTYAICSTIALFGITLYRKDLLNALNEFYRKCSWEKSPISLNFCMYLACIVPIININISCSIIVFALKTQKQQKEALATSIEKLVLESKKFKIK
jgi:hypothetical protein